MGLILTLDASVFVSACRSCEPGYTASRTLLSSMRDEGTPLIEPGILPVEVGAALCRTGSDPALARDFALAILALPYLTLANVDERLARRAVALATECRLRGADALYAAVAVHYGARLVTLDGEQLSRAPAAVHACKPDTAARLVRRQSRLAAPRPETT
jgi:predicted nucleic acid-binding protein